MYTLQRYNICNKNAAHSNLHYHYLQYNLICGINTGAMYLVITAGLAIIPLQGLAKYNDQELKPFVVWKCKWTSENMCLHWNNFLISTGLWFPHKDPAIRFFFHSHMSKGSFFLRSVLLPLAKLVSCIVQLSFGYVWQVHPWQRVKLPLLRAVLAACLTLKGADAREVTCHSNHLSLELCRTLELMLAYA